MDNPRWMSEIVSGARRRGQNMSSLLPTPDELSALRRKLIGRAQRTGLPVMDAEAVVDAAIQKALMQSSDETLPLEQRARQALGDERADYFRRQNARPVIVSDEVPDIPVGASPSAHLELIEQLQAIKEHFGDETLQFVFLKIMGFSEREIGEQPGWDPMRAARVRRRLDRQAPGLHDKLFPHINAPHSEQEKAS